MSAATTARAQFVQRVEQRLRAYAARVGLGTARKRRREVAQLANLGATDKARDLVLDLLKPEGVTPLEATYVVHLARTHGA